ncbi:MAG TPA: hypothetical protein VFA04_14680 [Bryobacteraceae bacterium]|nr:hypothetical protein [Bryobacteraceae bacterium]
MDIDERMEKLVDRVDALTQSVELLVSLHRDFESRTTAIMERLTDIAVNHEGRLRDLENGQ